ncbi:MAG: thermonuclease family protein [Pseudomonadota bacterium]
MYRLFFLLLALGLTPALHARTDAQISGYVISIADGDTLTLLTADKERVKVRLAEIDTPEKKQPYGQKAKQELAGLAFNKNAHISVVDIDRYGRVVGRVVVGDLEVNAELVRRGAAWVYRDYLKRPELIPLEAEARRLRKGLWALPAAERMPPWQWRKEQRDSRAAARLTAGGEYATR